MNKEQEREQEQESCENIPVSEISYQLLSVGHNMWMI